MKTASLLRRFGALILVIVLVFSLSAQAFAAGFKDIADDYWAKDYITELTELKFFDGYEDGTFRPNGEITYIETLVLLSRLYEVEDDILEMIISDHKKTVTDTIPATLQWASDSLCICLASDIVSANELGKLNLTNAINKKDFALLLVRALQLEGEVKANNNAKLPFADESSITGNYRGSVAILYNAKIVDGDNNNRFNPTQSVTRAVASALLYRALEFVAKEEMTLEVPGYKMPSATEGLITNVSGSTVCVRLLDGTRRDFTIGSGKYYFNGTLANPAASHVGAYISLVVTEDGIHKAEATTAEKTQYVIGTVYSTSTTYGGTVNIVPEGKEANANVRYVLADKAYVAIDGTKSEITSFKKNQFIFAKIVDGKLTEAYGTTKPVEIKGSLLELSFGSTVEMRIKDETGSVWYFDMDISDLPEVYMAEYEISIDRLELGDSLIVTFTNGKATKIVSDVAQGSLKGKITSIINNVDGIYWEITDANGILHKHPVAADATVYKGKTAILLSTIKVGDQVSVSLFNSTITTINLESSETAVQTGKITGTVLNVDNENREIILLINDKLFYVISPGSAPIYNAVTGKALGISQITPDSVIVAYGSYQNSTTLSATLVVVEALA